MRRGFPRANFNLYQHIQMLYKLLEGSANEYIFWYGSILNVLRVFSQESFRKAKYYQNNNAICYSISPFRFRTS